MSPASKKARRWRIWLGLALAITVALVCSGGLTVSFFLGNLGGESDPQYSFSCGQQKLIDLNAKLPRAGSFGNEQMRNAAIIIQVGQQLKVPPRGWVIAIATAMQESWLRNLGYLGDRNDKDSLGLFQQRPSQGWGTPEQVQDPAYAARKFYEHLLSIDGWERMSLTVAAQKVQRSAYPDAYAKHESRATLIVNLLTDGAARAAGSLVNLRCVSGAEIAASGWTVPKKGPIVSRFRTPDRPSHNGVDIGAHHGEDIRAAASGVVIKVRCQAIAPDGSNWGCYRDGGMSIRGCGWYVDIMHAGAIITRYCHMVSRPLVVAGQQVAAGDKIGLTGSSGRSSGPHLHFEVHTNGDARNSGAIDPIPFMEQVGAPLGEES